MLVIAMTDEIEAASAAIAEKLSVRLGLVHVSVKGVVPQTNPATLFTNRLRDNDFSASLRVVDAPDPKAACDDITTTVLEAAIRGNAVIRSACATGVLRPVEHVMRVRICASASRPTPRGTGYSLADDVATATEMPAPSAGCPCDAKQCLEPGIDRAHVFDVVLDVNRLSVDQCVDVLCELAGSPAFQPTAASTAELAGLMQLAGLKHKSRQPQHAPTVNPGEFAPSQPPVEWRPDDHHSLHEQLAHAERLLYGHWPNTRTKRAKTPTSLLACWT